MHLMTAQQTGNLPSVNSITWHRLYSDREFGTEQRFRLLLYLIGSSQDVDIYHFLFVPTLLTSLLLSTVVRLKRKRSIQTVPCLYRENISSTVAERLFFADRVIALSDWTAGRLRSLGIRDVVRINAGVDLDQVRPPSDWPRLRKRCGLPQDKVLLLFSGELTRLGSLEIILSTAARILTADSDLHLVLACPTRTSQDTVARMRAQQYIRRQDLEESVTFMGDVEDFSAVLGACDVLLFPVAKMTGKIDTPLTVLEAMATGLPVILTDLPPLNEVLKEGAGIATPVGDEEALVRAILLLAKDGSLRNEMGATARSVIETHYDIEQMVSAYESIYDELT